MIEYDGMTEHITLYFHFHHRFTRQEYEIMTVYAPASDKYAETRMCLNFYLCTSNGEDKHFMCGHPLGEDCTVEELAAISMDYGVRNFDRFLSILAAHREGM